MPQQFVVPQFLDVEPRIIGPITARQFVIILGACFVEFIIYRLVLSIAGLLILGIPVAGLAGIFAFARVNGQPFHYIVLNMIQTFRKPMLRVWDKDLTDAQLKELMKKDDVEEEVAPPEKRRLNESHLSDLSLLVNTGGVYNPEDYVE